MAGYLPSKLFVLLLFFLLYFFFRSCLAIFQPLGRHTWKKLIGQQASLQRNCNREAFNCKSFSKARIGIISNQENNCDSCDSRIGFGAGGYPIGDDNTCGNWARYGGDNGDRDIKAMGYILVQWVSGQSASSSRRTMINGTHNAYRNCRLISTQLV